MTRKSRAVTAALASLTTRGRTGSIPYGEATLAPHSRVGDSRVSVHGTVHVDRLVADILQALEED